MHANWCFQSKCSNISAKGLHFSAFHYSQSLSQNSELGHSCTKGIYNIITKSRLFYSWFRDHVIEHLYRFKCKQLRPQLWVVVDGGNARAAI